MVLKRRFPIALARKLRLAFDMNVMLLVLAEAALLAVNFGHSNEDYTEDCEDGGFRTNLEYTSLFFRRLRIELENFRIPRKKQKTLTAFYSRGTCCDGARTGLRMAPQLHAQLQAAAQLKLRKIHNKSFKFIIVRTKKSAAIRLARDNPEVIFWKTSLSPSVAPAARFRSERSTGNLRLFLCKDLSRIQVCGAPSRPPTGQEKYSRGGKQSAQQSRDMK